MLLFYPFFKRPIHQDNLHVDCAKIGEINKLVFVAAGAILFSRVARTAGGCISGIKCIYAVEIKRLFALIVSNLALLYIDNHDNFKRIMQITKVCSNVIQNQHDT